MSSFMSPIEARQSTNTNKVRMFNTDQLCSPERDEKWDRIKMVCTQPFNKMVQYGLSFVNLYTPDENVSEPIKGQIFGKFTLRPNSPDTGGLQVGSLFARRKELQSENLGAAAAIREASAKICESSTMMTNSPSSSILVPAKILPKVTENLKRKHSPDRNNSPDRHSRCKKQSNSDSEQGNIFNNSMTTKRNRNELLYNKDEEEPNEKIDKAFRRKEDSKTNKKDINNYTPSMHNLHNITSQNSSLPENICSQVSNSTYQSSSSSDATENSYTFTGKGKGSLNQTKASLNENKATSNQTTASLNQAKAALNEAKTSLNQAKASPNQAKASLINAKVSLNKAKASLNQAQNSPPQSSKVDRSRSPRQVRNNRNLRTRPFNKLLEDVVFVISGIQNPERANLRSAALSMGAKYKSNWDSNCTHLVCAFRNTPKFNQVKGKGKIVTHKWIQDCKSQRKKIPWRRYALDPEDKKKVESDDEIYDANTVKIPSRSPSPISRPKSPSTKKHTTKEVKSNSGSDTEDEIERIQARQHTKTPSPKDKKKNTSDAYSTDTDEEVIVKKKNKGVWAKTPDLLDLFTDRVFFIDDNIPSKNKALLSRYITAFNGKVEEYFTPAVTTIISTPDTVPLLKLINPKATFVTPNWIWECHNTQRLAPDRKSVV